MKRTIAFMLALVLVLSMNLTVSAAGGSITVNNAIDGTNYKLYKIFDATYKADPNPDADGDGTKDVVSYTLSDSSPVYDYMFVDAATKTTLFTRDPETGVIEKATGAQDADIISYLTTMVRALYDENVAPDPNDGCFVANQTAADQKVEFTGLDYGYYLIDKEDAEVAADDAKIAVTITTNTPSINVIDKNKAPGDMKKETTDTSVSIGDPVHWTVSFLATNYDGSDKVLKYTITDTLSSAWAAYNDDIVVKVGDTVLVKDTHYTLTPTNVDGKPGVKIEIPWANLDAEDKFVSFKYDALETVTITYSTTVLEAAATAPELKNTAEMEWEKESGGVGGDDVESETDTFNLGFTKVDGNNMNTETGKFAPLAGAQFKLYTDISCTDAYLVRVEQIADGLYRVSKADEHGNIKDDTIVSPANGAVVIQGLAAGTYYLKETKAPDGYNKLSAPIAVKVGETQKNADNTDKVDSEGKKIYVTSGMDVNGDEITDYIVNHENLEIKNNQGIELPSTGGEGTIMMITFGTVVAMAFAILMITQKKMSIYRD